MVRAAGEVVQLQGVFAVIVEGFSMFFNGIGILFVAQSTPFKAIVPIDTGAHAL